MKNGQTLFLTAQRDLKTDNPSPSDLYQIGTICQVKQILRLPGDNIRVLVEGKQRALAHQFFAAQDDKTCIYAEVEQLVQALGKLNDFFERKQEELYQKKKGRNE